MNDVVFPGLMWRCVCLVTLINVSLMSRWRPLTDVALHWPARHFISREALISVDTKPSNEELHKEVLKRLCVNHTDNDVVGLRRTHRHTHTSFVLLVTLLSFFLKSFKSDSAHSCRTTMSIHLWKSFLPLPGQTLRIDPSIEPKGALLISSFLSRPADPAT